MLRETRDAWVADNMSGLSAALAFYSVLSLIPFLVVMTAIAARSFGQNAVPGEPIWEMQDLIGSAGARAIEAVMQSARHSSAAATLLGSAVLLFAGSAVVLEMHDALNAMWRVPAAVALSGVAKFARLVRERFLLFALILSVGVLLLASLSVNALVSAITRQYGPFLPVSPRALNTVVFVISFVAITILFAAIYKIVPDVKLSWSDVIFGAGLTSLFFTAGKLAMGFYLGRANYQSTYGAAGSLLFFLIWMYYSAQLFYFGAEFTKIYARRRAARQTAARATS